MLSKIVRRTTKAQQPAPVIPLTRTVINHSVPITPVLSTLNETSHERRSQPSESISTLQKASTIFDSLDLGEADWSGDDENPDKLVSAIDIFDRLGFEDDDWLSADDKTAVRKPRATMSKSSSAKGNAMKDSRGARSKMASAR